MCNKDNKQERSADLSFFVRLPQGPLFIIFALFLPVNLIWDIFPQVHFKKLMPRDEILKKAEKFYKDFKPLQAPEKIMRPYFFYFDHRAGFYFQQNFGTAQTTKIYAAGKLPFFFWVIRFIEPDNPHEYRVYLGPNAQPIGFRWLPPEEYSIIESTREQAEKLALETLKKYEKIEDWDLLDFQSQKHPKRRDYKFTFKKKDAYKNASHRIYIHVSGNRILNFRYSMKVPEKYVKQFKRSNALADLLVQCSIFLDIILVFAAFYFFLKAHKEQDLEFKPALNLALLIYLVLIGAILNYMPNIIAFRYLPEKNFIVFYLAEFLFLATLAIIPAFATFLFTMAGLPLSSSLGESSKWESLLSLVRLDFNASVLHSFFLGTVMAIIMGGGETFFYFIAGKYFAVWIPIRNDLVNSLSTILPIFLPLSIGIAAGITEEIVFRSFGISFLRKIGLPAFLCYLFPAIAWAFAHSYEWVFPVYVRGIELVLGGLLFGYFYYRADLLSIIVAHYCYDVVAFGWPLFISQSYLDQVLGFLTIAVVIIPAFLGARKYFFPGKNAAIRDV
ncbi:lysostaphin resistance A-like protein [Candidatus Riflebacteria bacterium]